MNKIDLVITRHSGLVKYLRCNKIIDSDAEIVSHATADMITGKHVIGVLPHSLSCLCASFTEIPMSHIPKELRGEELDFDTVCYYAKPKQTYFVRTEEKEEQHTRNFKYLCRYIMSLDSEWSNLKDYLLDGESPFLHDLFSVSKAMDDMSAFTEYVDKYATEVNQNAYHNWLFNKTEEARFAMQEVEAEKEKKRIFL